MCEWKINEAAWAKLYNNNKSCQVPTNPLTTTLITKLDNYPTSNLDNYNKVRKLHTFTPPAHKFGKLHTFKNLNSAHESNKKSEFK